MSPKIWLIGMTQQSYNDIDISTKEIYQHFNGLVFVCHEPTTDGTKELLESRKGEGQIFSIPWLYHHGLSLNVILTSHKILPGDWCVIQDSKERLDTNFAKHIKMICNDLEMGNVGAVYFYSKILMFKYNPRSSFTMDTPHCVLSRDGIIGSQMEISQLAGFENVRHNSRPQTRPQDHFIDHFAKYIFEYKHNNNQTLWGCENDLQLYQSREQARQKLLLRCRDLGIDLTLNSLKQYLLKTRIMGNLDETIKSTLNTIDSLNDYYCYYILDHSLNDILDRRKEKKLFIID